MKHFTLLERADIIKTMYENMSSILKTKRAFRKKCPTAKTLRDLTKKIENPCSIMVSVGRGRIRTISTIENYAYVKEDVKLHPETLCSHPALQLVIKKTSLW